MKLTRLKAGQRVVIREAAYNAFCDAAEANARNVGGSSVGGGNPCHRLVVQVKNNTGAQIAFGACVMLAEASSSLRVFTGDKYETSSNPAFSAVFRSSTVTTMFPQRFGVAVEPIPDGKFGFVCVRGVCVAYCASNPTTGWLMPEFTSSSSSFVATTKRTSVQVLHATTDSYTVVYLDDAPWQTRRSYSGAPTTVTSATRGQTYGAGSNADGFEGTATVTLSAGLWEGVIADSIIKVPCAGMYDFRFNVHGMMTLNGNSLPASGMTGSYPWNTTNISLMAKIVLVDSAGAYISGVNWPSFVSGQRSAGLINAPVTYEHSGGLGYGYSGQHFGSAMLETRFSLFDSPSLSVGVMAQVYSGAPTPPSIELAFKGTGIIEPAMQDVYVDPPP